MIFAPLLTFIFCGKHPLLLKRIQVRDPGPTGPPVLSSCFSRLDLSVLIVSFAFLLFLFNDKFQNTALYNLCDYITLFNLKAGQHSQNCGIDTVSASCTKSRVLTRY